MLYEIRIKRMLLALALVLGLPTGLLARPTITDFSQGKGDWAIAYEVKDGTVDESHLAKPAQPDSYVSEIFYAALEGDVPASASAELNPGDVFIGFHNGAVGQDVLGPRRFPSEYYQKSYTYTGNEPKRASWSPVNFQRVEFLSPVQDCSGLGVVQVGVVFYYVSQYAFDVRLEYSVDGGAWQVVDAKECYALEDPLTPHRSFKTWERLHLQGVATDAAGQADVRFRVRTKARGTLEYINRGQIGETLFDAVSTLENETFDPRYEVKEEWDPLAWPPALKRNADSLTATHYIGIDDFHIGTEPLYLVDYRMSDFMLRHAFNIRQTVNQNESDWTKNSYWKHSSNQNLNDRLGHLTVQPAGGDRTVCKNYYALLREGAVGPRVEYIKGVPQLTDGSDTYFSMWTDGTKARVHQVASVTEDRLLRAAMGSRVTVHLKVTNFDAVKTTVEGKGKWKGGPGAGVVYKDDENISVWYSSLGYEFVSNVLNDKHLKDLSGYADVDGPVGAPASDRTDFVYSSEPLRVHRLAGINYDFEPLWICNAGGSMARNTYSSTGAATGSTWKGIWGTSAGYVPGEEMPPAISFVIRAAGYKSLAGSYTPGKRESSYQAYTLVPAEKQTKICVKDRKTGLGIPNAEVHIDEWVEGPPGHWKRWVQQIKTNENGEWVEQLSDGVKYVFSAEALGYLPGSTEHSVVGTGAESVDVWLDAALICTFKVLEPGGADSRTAMVMAPATGQHGRVMSMTVKETGGTGTTEVMAVDLNFPKAGGEFDVFAESPGYMQGHKRVKVDGSSCRLAGEDATEAKVIALQLPNAGTLKVKVEDGSGNLLPNAEIYLGALPQPALNTTDGVWEYSIGLDSEYRLLVRHAGYARWSELKTWASSGGTEHALTVRLSDALCQTKLKLKGHDGLPVAGVRVSVAPDHDVAYWTDVNGEAMVPLPNGADAEFALTLAKDGYETEYVEVAVQQNEVSQDVPQVMSKVFELPVLVTLNDASLTASQQVEKIRQVLVSLQRESPAGKEGSTVGRPTTAGRLVMQVVEGSQYTLAGHLTGYSSEAKTLSFTSAPTGDAELVLEKGQVVTFDEGVFTVNGGALHSGDRAQTDDVLLIGLAGTLLPDQKVRVSGADPVAPTTSGEAGSYKVVGDSPVKIEVAVPLLVSTTPPVTVKDSKGINALAVGTLLAKDEVIIVPERDAAGRLLTVVGAEKVLPVEAGKPVKWRVKGDVAVDVQVVQVELNYREDIADVTKSGATVSSGSSVEAGTVVAISADGGLKPGQVLSVVGATPEAGTPSGKEGDYKVDGDRPVVVKVGYPLANATSPLVDVKNDAGVPVKVGDIVQKGDKLVVPATSGADLVQVEGATLVGYDAGKDEYTWEATGDGPVKVVAVAGYAVSFEAAEASVVDGFGLTLTSGDKRLKDTELTIGEGTTALEDGQGLRVSGAKPKGGTTPKADGTGTYVMDGSGDVEVQLGYLLKNKSGLEATYQGKTDVLEENTVLLQGDEIELPATSAEGYPVAVENAEKVGTPSGGKQVWRVTGPGAVKVSYELLPVNYEKTAASVADANGTVEPGQLREAGTELTVGEGTTALEDGQGLRVSGAEPKGGTTPKADGTGTYVMDGSGDVEVQLGYLLKNKSGLEATYQGKSDVLEENTVLLQGEKIELPATSAEGYPVVVENATEAGTAASGDKLWEVTGPGAVRVSYERRPVNYEKTAASVTDANGTVEPGQQREAGTELNIGQGTTPLADGQGLRVSGAEPKGGTTPKADGTGTYVMDGSGEVEVQLGYLLKNKSGLEATYEGKTDALEDNTVLLLGQKIELPATSAEGYPVAVENAEKVGTPSGGKQVWRVTGPGAVKVSYELLPVNYEKTAASVADANGTVEPGQLREAGTELTVGEGTTALEDGQGLRVSGAEPKGGTTPKADGTGTYVMDGSGDVEVKVGWKLTNSTDATIETADGSETVENGSILCAGDKIKIPATDTNGHPVAVSGANGPDANGVWEVIGTEVVKVSIKERPITFADTEVSVMDGTATLTSGDTKPVGTELTVSAKPAGMVPIVTGGKLLANGNYEVQDEDMSITVGYPLQNETTATVLNADGTKEIETDTPLPLGTEIRLPESVDGKLVKVIGATKSTTKNGDDTYSWVVNDTEGMVKVVTVNDMFQVLFDETLATIVDSDSNEVHTGDWRKKGMKLTVKAKDDGKVYVEGATLDATSYDKKTGNGTYTVEDANVVVKSGRAVSNPNGVSATWKGKTVEDGDIVPEGAKLIVDSKDSEGNVVAVLNATKGAEDPGTNTTEWVVDQAGDPVISVAGLMVSYDETKASVLKPNAAGDAGDPAKVVPNGKKQAVGSFIFVSPVEAGQHVAVAGAEYLGTSDDGSGKYRLTGVDAKGNPCDVKVSVGIPFSNPTDVAVAVDGVAITKDDGTVLISKDAVIEADATDSEGNDVVLTGVKTDADGKVRPDGSGSVAVSVPGYTVDYDETVALVTEVDADGAKVSPDEKQKKPLVLYIQPAEEGQYVVVSGAKPVDVDEHGAGTYELDGEVAVKAGARCENPAGIAVTDAAGNVLNNGTILAVGTEIRVPVDADGKPLISEISGATLKGGVWYVDGSGPVVLSRQQGFHLSDLGGTPVEKGQAVALRVWPNPTSGLVHVEGLAERSVVLVYSLLGKELLHVVLEEGEALDMGSLERGVYLLLVNGRAVRVVKR